MPAIVSACNEEDIAWWLDQVPQPYGEADARTYVALTRRGWKDGTHAAFAVLDAETDEVVGSVGLHWLDTEHGVAEVGYWVRAESRGRGATRATPSPGADRLRHEAPPAPGRPAQRRVPASPGRPVPAVRA